MNPGPGPGWVQNLNPAPPLVSIVDKSSNIGVLHVILNQFWALNTNPALFFRKSISIDRYIDFQSINISIFDKFSNIGVLHIILDQFWPLNTNPALFFRKSRSIDIFTYAI